MDVFSLSLMRSSILYRNPEVPLKQYYMSGILGLVIFPKINKVYFYLFVAIFIPSLLALEDGFI